MGCAESTSSSSAVENDSSRKVQQQASRNAVDEDKDQAYGKGLSGEDLIPPPSGARLAMVNPFSSSATSNLMESTSSLLSNGSAVKRVTFEVLQGGSSATSSHAGTPRSGNSEEPAISMFPIYGQHQKGSNGGSQAEELCFPPVSMPQRPRSMSSGVQEGDLHGPVFTGPGVGLQHIVPSAPVAVFSNQPSTNQTTTSDGQSAQGDPFMNSDSLRQQVLVGGGVVGPTRPLGVLHVPGAATLTGAAIPTLESNSVQAWLVGASKPKVMPLVGQSNIHNTSTAETAPLDTLLSPSFTDKEPERPPVPGPHGMMISISSNQLGSQEEGLSISELPAGAERDPGDAGQGYQYPALKPAGNATCTSTATAGPTVGGDPAVDPQDVSEPSEVQLTPIALQQHNKIMSRAGKQLSGTELQQGGGD